MKIDSKVRALLNIEKGRNPDIFYLLKMEYVCNFLLKV